MTKSKVTITVALTIIVFTAFTAVVAILAYRTGRAHEFMDFSSNLTKKLSLECLRELSTP